MYGMQYGVDIDAYCSTFDPAEQFRTISKLTSDTFLQSRGTQKMQVMKQRRALIAAIQLSGRGTTSSEMLERLKLSPASASKEDIVSLTRRRQVYFSHTPDDLPIVIDSGASLTLTPNRSDFIGKLRVPKITELKGLNSNVKVTGVGTVEWTIRDVFGAIRTIRTEAYYVPDASIRLFSPQTYFIEKEAGQLLMTAHHTVLTLADGSELEFPYNMGSNLPLMLPHMKSQVGLTYDDVTTLSDEHSIKGYLSVADEVNQNITPSQKELLKWHWRLGHAGFQWVQKLAAKRKQPVEGTESPILRTQKPSVSSCPPPMCCACQLAKQSRRGAGSSVETRVPKMDIRQGDLKPGQCVSIDQYMSALPGRLPHTKGKEKKKDQYNGGTLFVDHATGFMYLKHQVSLKAGETIKAKRAFEQLAAEYGIKIQGYRADNVPFGSAEFRRELENNDQTIDFSGTGAHHQNGVAERAIQTVTQWARAMLLHAVIHWPSEADLTLWPFALEYAIYLWNNMPSQQSLIAPLELFSQQKFPSYDQLHRAHVWGCPVYVLEPKLQDGKKLPKWLPRSRRGRFLGISPEHSSTVGRILNLRTGSISPQYHVVYDDLYTTVPNAETGGLINPDEFDAAQWRQLLETGTERYYEDEYDERGNLIPPPELSDDWLTPPEQAERTRARQQRRQHHRRATGPVPTPEGAQQDGPVTAPEGDGAPEVVLPPQPNNNNEAPAPEGDDDDIDFPEQDDPESNDDRSEPEGAIQEPQDQPELLGRGRRPFKKNRRYFNEDNIEKEPGWVNHCYGSDPKAKFRASALNQQFLNSLNWKLAKEVIRSQDLNKMLNLMQNFTDPENDLVEWMHPMILAAKANAEDCPNWEEAMNGPFKEGYWEACEKELQTLQDMDAWDIVDRKGWMNVLPSTWAFKCKRFPHGGIRKLKSRFCCRGDRQIEGVDYFDTFAPVVNWTTVRLMLILSIILGLSTKQVDYTAAFVHAPIDKDPDWDNLTIEEQERSGVYLEMPRGFSQPGKVLKLKRSLYGLKQSPRNFFQHLKGKLEDIGFESADEVDPCLFISDKVICLVYVDDTLFYSPKPEYIDEVIQKLKDKEMDLEAEDSVAGFLGVHIEHNEKDGTIKLTQEGLSKRIIEALDIGHLPPKYTPAVPEALVIDKEGEPPNGTYNYASVIGMLQYLQGHSRPDITFAVSQCARYVHNTRRSHEIALERIGQYLKKTMDEGLILKPTGLLDIDCYVDADFAGLWPYEDKQDPSSVKSRTGFAICISNCPVIWTSKLQQQIATCTMEAEYNALSIAMKDVLPLKRLVNAVGHSIGLDEERLTTFKTTVWEDNVGAMTLANLEPGRMTPRSKFYAVKYHWFRSHLKPNRVVIEKIDTNEQRADILTKGLRRAKFEEIRKLLCGW